MRDIDDFTTEELVNELDRRTIACVICVCRPEDDGEESIELFKSGNLATQLGMLSIARRTVVNQMMGAHGG